MNIFDFALKMEEDGKTYYERLANEALLPGLMTIFSRLAEDEQKHYDIFQKLKNGATISSLQDSTMIAEVKNVFADLLQDMDTDRGGAESLAAYQHAMQLEAESYRLYEHAASKEGNQEIKALLLKIAAEERKHFTVLENIYHFVNVPNQYMAWSEFSNLDEVRQFGRDTDD